MLKGWFGKGSPGAIFFFAIFAYGPVCMVIQSWQLYSEGERTTGVSC